MKDSADPELILMASGSEVAVTLKASEDLIKQGIRVRVVSFPSWELFDKQDDAYKESVLPSGIKARVSVEAGVTMGWHRYTGNQGIVIGIERFGHSAPEKIVMDKYGFNTQNIIDKSMAVLKKSRELQSAG